MHPWESLTNQVSLKYDKKTNDIKKKIVQKSVRALKVAQTF